MNNTFSKLTFIALLTSLLFITSCKKSQPSGVTQTAQEPNLVMANESLLAQIKISEVTQSDVSDILRVAGQIDFDEQALTRIGASVTGRVTQINAQLGNEVKKGDTLALINSSELSNSQLAYLKARSEKASAQTRAAQDQLRVLGVNLKAMEELATTGAIDSVASVMATIKGVVVERKVTTGQVVQPADVLFTVADLSRVWAVAQVPEQQVAQVKVGQSVRIEVPALENEKLIGKLIYVGQTVNPESRTVLVRTELDNTSGHLKPSMLASMLIESTPTKRMVVPITAIVREQDADYVFIEEKPGSFRLKPVRLSSEHNGQRVVLDGLSQGMRIVSDGAFHLNNYRNLKDMEKGD